MIHINRPPPARLLHECTLTLHLHGEVVVVAPLAATPRTQARCHKCNRTRWACKLLVIRQAYYDPLIYCADGCAAVKKKRNAQDRRRRALRKKESDGKHG